MIVLGVLGCLCTSQGALDQALDMTRNPLRVQIICQLPGRTKAYRWDFNTNLAGLGNL